MAPEPTHAANAPDPVAPNAQAVVRPAVRAGVKPAGFWLSVAMILGVLVLSEVVGDTLRPLLAGTSSGSELVLLAVGGAALLGLLAVNARWIWYTIGNLRYALALIFLWTISSILGTLVVQRFPNQTDDGYARTFIDATGDFAYNMSHYFSGVRVLPAPDVEAWLQDSEKHFGPLEGAETRKGWTKSEENRIRSMEIRRFTQEHHAALEDVLAAVSVVRLPEAFQISVWFKTLLALLCLSLVVVVIQRWRGEWRQVGWAMAHLGMVVFCIGASVRATRKVDGFLPMKVGETASSYFRKVGPEHDPKDPAVVTQGGQRQVFTPLDFELTLHRFKTDYPKQLFVTFPADEVQRPFRLDEGWERTFAGGGLTVHVDSVRDNVHVDSASRERASGPLAPAVELEYSGDWLEREQSLGLPDNEDGATVLIPPSNSLHLEYRRAADEAQAEQLATRLGRLGQLWTRQGELIGAVEVGSRWDSLPGAPDVAARVVAIFPDSARRSAPDAAQADPTDPVVQLMLERAGSPLGVAWVHGDHAELPDGVTLPVDLRFQYDYFAGPAPVRYRIVGLAGRDPELVTIRDGAVAERRVLHPGDEVSLGAGGDRIRFVRSHERYSREWSVGPADTTGMTPADVYYASLPTEVVLRITGPLVADLARNIGQNLDRGVETPADSGITDRESFAAGYGQMTATADSQGLLVRFVSDHQVLSAFPNAALQAALKASGGSPLPVRLDYTTNDRAQPLRFTSDVTLSQGGVPLKRALVEPNKPLYLAGFQFSQADFRKDDPTYSGFGVVRDPSVRIVYFGMAVLVLGVVLLFYVNPILSKRRKAPVRASAPAVGTGSSPP